MWWASILTQIGSMAYDTFGSSHPDSSGDNGAQIIAAYKAKEAQRKMVFMLSLVAFILICYFIIK